MRIIKETKKCGKLVSITLDTDESEVIKKLAWASSGTLVVSFMCGSTYCYDKVEVGVIKEVMYNSKSLGRSFIHLIKNGNYTYERLW